MSRPRDGWEATVISQGLTYPTTPHPDGSSTNYWNESAWYEFTMDEVLTIESVTEELWGMCVQAVSRMARDLDDGGSACRSGPSTTRAGPSGAPTPASTAASTCTSTVATPRCWS